MLRFSNLGGTMIITYSNTLPSDINTENRYYVPNLTPGGICLGVRAANMSNNQQYDLVGAGVCSAYINGSALRITIIDSKYIDMDFVDYIMIK
jgi:hypothetical protein